MVFSNQSGLTRLEIIIALDALRREICSINFPRRRLFTQPRPKADIADLSFDHLVGRASRDGGMISPRVLAVFRFMIRSNFLGDCTGRPDGFAPRSIRSTYPAPARNRSFEISDANPLWGAPRIHGELLKLGVDVGQTTVAKYMAKKATIVARLEDAPSQSCRRYRVDRSVCRPHDFISASGPAAFATGALVVGWA